MTEELIKKMNEDSSYDQGIFREPYGIPVKIKEPVVYLRYEIGGYSGGSCWDDSNPQPYSLSEVPNWDVLDTVINELKPNITYMQFKAIERLVHTNEETEYEYYGNSTEWMVKYIILSELETLLSTF